MWNDLHDYHILSCCKFISYFPLGIVLGLGFNQCGDHMRFSYRLILLCNLATTHNLVYKYFFRKYGRIWQAHRCHW